MFHSIFVAQVCFIAILSLWECIYLYPTKYGVLYKQIRYKLHYYFILMRSYSKGN